MRIERKAILFAGTALAVGLGSMAIADKPNVSPLGDETYATPNNSEQVRGGDVVFPAACDTFVYDSGDSPTVNTGRTVGQPSADRWEVYQPIVLDQDTTVCGIDLDGWYVTGTPTTFMVQICEELSNGDPDYLNPLTGAPINLGGSGNVDWDQVDVAPVLLNGGQTYYVYTDSGSNNNHWSAIYRDPALYGMGSFSIKNDDFSNRYTSYPIALRLRGEAGSGDCLTMAVDTLFAGGTADWNVSGADPNTKVAIVYGFRPGTTAVNGYGGYCATFGIAGVNQSKLICQKTSDAAGDVTCTKRIPGNAAGMRVLTQAAMQGTCPDECMSNLDDQVVQ